MQHNLHLIISKIIAYKTDFLKYWLSTSPFFLGSTEHIYRLTVAKRV